MKYLLLFLFFLLSFTCATTQSSSPPPNVVFILVDDLGWKDLGCYGSAFYETPRLDAFAAEAVRFTSAYASSPVCSPTRAAIMTGRHPARVNITDWIPGQNPPGTKLTGPEDRDNLALDEYTLAEAFRDNGYTTFFAGKWHLGGEGYYPEDQGFDINKGGHDKGSPPGGYYAPYQNPKLADGPEGEYLPDRLTDESLHFIEENQDRPFFLFLSFYTVHTPIQASRRHVDKYRNKAAALPDSGRVEKAPEHEGMTVLNQVNPDYASMVEAMDENVGRLLDALKAKELYDNTIVVFTSDNGGLTTLPPNHTAPTSVRPLRAGKGWCYEGGIRVPLIMHIPGKTKGGQISDVPVVSHDFFPTLAKAAGLSVPDSVLFDGASLLPVLEGQPLGRDALFWHYPHYHGSTWTPGAAIREGDWKLIQFYHWEKTELYNLNSDAGETRDLSKQFPERVRSLKQLLLEMQRAHRGQFPKKP